MLDGNNGSRQQSCAAVGVSIKKSAPAGTYLARDAAGKENLA
ncbi:hypothetical protein [Aerosakkonema funiforme]|nr:hypothetical protein [Aerosakkonema funiforme]